MLNYPNKGLLSCLFTITYVFKAISNPTKHYLFFYLILTFLLCPYPQLYTHKQHEKSKNSEFSSLSLYFSFPFAIISTMQCHFSSPIIGNRHETLSTVWHFEKRLINAYFHTQLINIIIFTNIYYDDWQRVLDSWSCNNAARAVQNEMP